MRIRAILSAAGLAAAAVTVAPLSAAQASTSVTLPLTSYYQMAVDSTHDHLFFSQGSTSENTILVTDFSGKTVATITGQTGVMGIALSPDGTTLYAALTGADEVTAISTATLQQTAAYPLGGVNTPFNVAVQSGKLWVSYDTGTAGESAIGDFVLSAASPVLETQAAMGGWNSAPVIAADPLGTGNVLVAMQSSAVVNQSQAASYDTAAEPATLLAGEPSLTGGSASCVGLGDLAVVPGGAQFIPACRSYSGFFRYSTADLSTQGSYASVKSPTSVATAAGAGLVALGRSSPTGNEIYIYSPGAAAPLNWFNLSGGWANRNIGLTADGSKLFVVTSSAGHLELNVYDHPSVRATSLTLSGTNVPIGHAVTLSGTLLGADDWGIAGTSPIAGAAIAVTRTGPGGTATLTATTGSNGRYTLTDTPAVAGNYSYAAHYAGKAPYGPASVNTKVTVSKLVPSLSISVTPASATYRPAVHVTVHLGATDGDKTVSVYAKPAGSTRQVLLKTGTVNSTGTMKLIFPAAHSTTFSAVFAGDATYGPRTVTATASVAAAVIMKTGGYYASERVGSVTYRLYHRAKRLLVAVAVTPNKHGECVKFDVQELYKGKWYDSLTACGTLDKNSMIGGYFTLSKADLGYHYRLRAEYLRGKDTTNLSADSTWQYFIVEK